MTRTALLGGALLLAAAGATACHPAKLGQGRDRSDRAMTVAARLDCPDRQGELRRVDEAADGRSCRYSGPDGQEVTLGYLAVTGSPQAALAPIEAEFHSLIPAAAAPEPGSLPRAAHEADDAQAEADRAQRLADRATGEADRAVRDRDDDEIASGLPTPPKPPEPPQVERSWSTGASSRGESVHINLPFLHIDTDGTGKARVRTIGADIDADENGKAIVRAGWNGRRAVINAHDGGVEMRFGSVGEHRADLTYIVASDAAGPGGYKAAAYVAKGPVAGPLVIASGRTREEMRDKHDDKVDDLRRLVNRNVRVGDGGGPR